MEVFEDQNGLTELWNTRYSTDEDEISLVRQVRKKVLMQLYSRPVTGWKLSCELGSKEISREKAYKDIIKQQFKS